MLVFVLVVVMLAVVSSSSSTSRTIRTRTRRRSRRRKRRRRRSLLFLSSSPCSSSFSSRSCPGLQRKHLLHCHVAHMGAGQKSRYVTGSRASFRDIGFVTKPFCLRQAVRDKPPRQASATSLCDKPLLGTAWVSYLFSRQRETAATNPATYV